LEFDDDVIGGKSLFLDAFEAAERLRQQDAISFDTLTRIPAQFQKVLLWPLFVLEERSLYLFLFFLHPLQ
jgi:hypothetical protein